MHEPEIFRDATANTSEARGPGEHGCRAEPGPGGRGDLVPPGQLIGPRAGAHPAESIGEVRSDAAETDEEMEELLVFVARGRGTRALPGPAGEAAVLGADVASRSFPGGFGHGLPPGARS
jgi:hypothetical protein